MVLGKAGHHWVRLGIIWLILVPVSCLGSWNLLGVDLFGWEPRGLRSLGKMAGLG